MKRYSLRPNTAILRRSRWGQKTDIERPLDEGGWACAEPSSPGPPLPPTHTPGRSGRQDCGRAQSKVAVLAITQNAAYQRDIDCGEVELLGAWELGRLNAEYKLL